jgi:hypothetical protein
MARSLAAGDYTLLMAVESASAPHSFYRILQSLHDGQLSCDCPAWRFSRATVRICKHTQPVAPLVRMADADITSATLAAAAPSTVDPVLVRAIQHQWPMLTGTWGTQARHMLIGDEGYRVVLVTLLTPNDDFASGAVAMAECHGHRATMLQAIAAWTGYAIASGIARRNGYPLQNTPPQHFIHPGRQPRTAQTPPTRPIPRQPSHLGLGDILRAVGDQEQLGDHTDHAAASFPKRYRLRGEDKEPLLPCDLLTHQRTNIIQI